MVKIGLVTISDRASSGVYDDLGGPAMYDWLDQALSCPWQASKHIIADEQALIEQTLINLADDVGCCLILTTGGTGPAKRDVTPEATLAVADKVMDGFAEQMRAVSLKYVPTAILSRQVAVIRNQALIINLPGKPSAIAECLDAVFPAVPYCVDLLEGPFITTHPEKVTSFRPKHARQKADD
ncbi:molybdopterin adenylyltransferase [Thiomicrospira cyclica]|uniref:Molybdopterin adenylyltransferase n=1 Tax=Thiomicrospira cyclica (strain DSM 14477 / JCM 11371 / ALM1) TaxID=717773 RepID=F6DBA4_THICA|nr:molybdopterin adenylyltransferase [Thiomicrospira cyclica]AEG31212.1 molybdenum cofactor synthesis domain protein [Thiomicrospira cyclica ALM1]